MEMFSLMAKEVADVETGTITSRQRQIMEAEEANTETELLSQ